ncbi:hypothetical protein [uncultured Ruminococcus sp.]|uniref:hypothetical protein n=1 Tax=uncultured Ruminococcus sp. TaxID=165186 RepID=UPI00260A4991|nr:hypothetical protein [uncultured Ruminococcus sp.]
MEFRKNPDLEEKPDHLHYPICRGRLDAINEMSTGILKFSLIASAVLCIVSLIGIPLHVVGWLPLIFTLKEADGDMGFLFSVVQSVISLLPAAMALLGCTERKKYDVILFFFYALMFVFSLFVRLTALDAVTVIIGGVGVVKCFGMLKGYVDFRQLRKTEGYPVFSVVLAEYDDRKKQSPDGYYRDPYDRLMREKLRSQRNMGKGEGNDQLRNLTEFAQPMSEQTDGLGDMPELDITAASAEKAAPDRFTVKSGKYGVVLFSEMKLR